MRESVCVRERESERETQREMERVYERESEREREREKRRERESVCVRECVRCHDDACLVSNLEEARHDGELKPSRPRLVPARPKVCTSHVREPFRFPKKTFLFTRSERKERSSQIATNMPLISHYVSRSVKAVHDLDGHDVIFHNV